MYLILVYCEKITINRNDVNERINDNTYDYRITIPLNKISEITNHEKRAESYFGADKQSKEIIFFLSFKTLYEQKAIKVEKYDFIQVSEYNKIVEKSSSYKVDTVSQFDLLVPEKTIAMKLEKAFLELKSRVEMDEIF